MTLTGAILARPDPLRQARVPKGARVALEDGVSHEWSVGQDGGEMLIFAIPGGFEAVFVNLAQADID